MILLGIQGLETGKIGVPDEELRLSFEGVITKVKNLNKTLREQKITIVSKDLGSYINVENNEYSIDVARLVHDIEEQNPDYLVLAFDYSSFNEINTMLRAEGVYANLMIQTDLQNLNGRVIKHDLPQKRFIKKFVETKPKNVLVTGPLGSGQKLFIRQLLAIKASEMERNKIPFKMLIIYDSEYLQSLPFMTNEINKRRQRNGEKVIDFEFTTLDSMMRKQDIIPKADNKDLAVMTALVSKGRLLNKFGWFYDEIGAPSVFDAIMEKVKDIDVSFDEDELLIELNEKSNFHGKVSINWLMYELAVKIKEESTKDFIGLLRRRRQKWLRYLFWMEYQAQNPDRKSFISEKLNRLIQNIAQEQPNVETLVMVLGFQLDYGVTSFDKTESKLLDWQPKTPENINLFIGVDPMSWQDFEIPLPTGEELPDSDSMFIFLNEKYRISSAIDALITDIISDYDLPLALKELQDSLQHPMMLEGSKPGWLKLDNLEYDADILATVLADKTADFTEVYWSCPCPSDQKKYEAVSNSNWTYVPYQYLDEAAATCVVVFGVPTGKQKNRIQRKLAKLIGAAKKSLTIVTEDVDEGLKKQNTAIRMLQG